MYERDKEIAKHNEINVSSRDEQKWNWQLGKKRKRNWEDKPLELCSGGANDFQSRVAVASKLIVRKSKKRHINQAFNVILWFR